MNWYIRSDTLGSDSKT